jgi:multidrug resistance protein, MATE family
VSDRAVDLSSGRRLGRAVWTVSLPILFAGVSETVIRVTDTVFLARVGTVELGAFALADTLLDVWLVPVVGLTEAMVILVGRRVGQQWGGAVRSTFLRGMGIVLLAALVLAVALRWGAPTMGDLLAESADVGEGIEQFLRIAAFGLVFLALNLGFSALYTGLGRTRVLIGAAIVISVTNFLFSYALILGRLGFPALGLEGSAWSFVAAEIVGFCYLGFHTLRRGVLRVGDRDAVALDCQPVRHLLRLSPPVAMRALIEGARWLLFFMIMEQVSEQAVASANIVYACFATMLIATDAFGDTTYSLVSNLVGRGDKRRIRSLIRRVIWANYLLSLPLLVVAGLAPGALLRVFAFEGGDIPSAALDLRFAALGVLLMIPAEMWIAAVAGTGDTDAAFVLEVVVSILFVVWAYWATLVAGLAVPFAWLGPAITALVGLPVAYWWVRSGRWERRSL